MADVLKFPKPSPTLAAHTPATQGPVYTPGDRGAGVKLLQAQLRTWGFDPKKIDGIYGQDTTAAVSALQRKLGIAVDGKFGNKTRDAIAADLASNASVIRQVQAAVGLAPTGPMTPAFPTQPPTREAPSAGSGDAAGDEGTVLTQEAGVPAFLKSPALWLGLGLGLPVLWLLIRWRRMRGTVLTRGIGVDGAGDDGGDLPEFDGVETVTERRRRGRRGRKGRQLAGECVGDGCEAAK